MGQGCIGFRHFWSTVWLFITWILLKETDYPLDSIRDACFRAAKLDATVVGGDIPETNTSRVYRLRKAIVAKALPSQLPDALKELNQNEW